MKKQKLSLVLALCCLATSLFAQNIAIKGTIVDAQSKEPVPYASIVVKGGNSFATSQEDGSFKIEAPANGALKVVILGYAAQEIEVNGRSFIAVEMTPEFDQLAETVVIGYGTQQKKLLTGSSVQVKGEEIAKLSTTSSVGALQGQTPGVTITQNSGQPGQGYKVNIRGIGTIGDSEPLYVIDGVAGGSLSALNPSDIESIDVLKDAASAAIYGARAANGVVLVTTKQGKEGRAVVSYDGYFGGQYIQKMPNTANGQEYMQLYDMMLVNEGQDKTNWAQVLPHDQYAALMNGTWKGTDWLNEAYKKGAMTTNHVINVGGGSADHTYSLGLSYTGQEGILGYNQVDAVNSNFKRYTFRVNTDNVVIKRNNLDILRIGNTLNFNYSQNCGIAEGDIYWNSVHNYLRTTPLLPAYTRDKDGNVTGFYDQAARDADGWKFDASTTSSANPLALDALTSRGKNESRSFNLQGSVFLTLQLIKNLKFKTQFGYVMSAGSSRYQEKTYAINGKSFNDVETIGQSMSVNQKYTWENTLAYSWTAGTKHNFDAVIGQSIEKWGFGESISGESSNSKFPNDWTRAWLSNTNPTSLSQIGVSGKPRTQGGLASFFGRINYNYDGKYLFSATVRADGSSNFARGHRWGVFPSVSGGWVMSSEPWMEDAKDWLSFLKIRASWGQNGNASISNFQYLSTISLDADAGYHFNNKEALSQGAVGDILGNDKVSWETSEQADFGVDARFFDSRLGVSLDGYIKTTKDWLVRAPIASVYGLNAPYVNGGDVRNSGVEFAIDWGKYTGEFKYSIKFNGAYNKNKVTRIANSEGIIHGEEDVLSEGTLEMYRAQVGYPIGYFYGYQTAGVFQNQAQIDSYTGAKYDDAQPGDLIYVDTNKDGVIDDDDRTMIGNPHPDFTTGLNLWFAYKGFDLNITGYGAFGQQIAKSYRSFADSQKDNFTTDFFNTWQGEGTSNRLPKLTYGNNRNWQQISDIYIENGDYFKISNLSLGYDFQRLFKSTVISKCRLYLAANNLFTITKYSGMDPEIGYGFDEDWVSGIDLGFYPSPRTFLIGINLSF